MLALSFTPDRQPRDLFFTADFTAEEQRSRRERIAAQIGAGAHLLIAGAPPVPSAVGLPASGALPASGLAGAADGLAGSLGAGDRAVSVIGFLGYQSIEWQIDCALQIEPDSTSALKHRHALR